jgi:hypothetical protein
MFKYVRKVRSKAKGNSVASLRMEAENGSRNRKRSRAGLRVKYREMKIAPNVPSAAPIALFAGVRSLQSFPCHKQ